MSKKLVEMEGKKAYVGKYIFSYMSFLPSFAHETGDVGSEFYC